MVRHWHGEIATLQDVVRAHRMLWGLCRHCGHSARIDPRSIAFRYGALDLATLRARLRCIRCKSAGRAAIVIDDRVWPGMH